MSSESVPAEQQARLIEKGRITFEALRSREQEAHFHAESLELSLALRDAELGQTAPLMSWMQKHDALVPEIHRAQSSLEPPHFEQEPPIVQSRLPASKGLVSDDCSNQTQATLWNAMVQGARQRNRQRQTQLDSGTSSIIASDVIEVQESSIAFTPENETDVIERPEAQERQSLPTPLNGSSAANDAIVSLARKPAAINPEANLVVPSWLKTLDQPKKEEKYGWLWLTPSILFSMLAHILVVAVMSVVAIRMVKIEEPKAIVASTVDTNQVSMEAPVEISSMNVEELDTTEPVAPTLPTFSNEPAEAASSSVELPSSMVGLGPSSNESSSSSSVEQAAQMASKSMMPTNAAEFFGVKATGNTFCYLVDCSPSMRNDNAFSAAKAELVRSLSLLKPKQRYFISFFAREIVDLTLDGRSPERFPIYATPENLRSTLSWIEQVRVQDNGKAPNEALQRAIAMDPDGIFLLFDGDTTVDVPSFLRKSNRSTDLLSSGEPLVPIHTLGFYDVEHQTLMKRIAQENNGTFRFVPNPIRKP